MTWQNGRKLTTLQQGSNSISYKYDSNGVRTSKTVNGVEYTYEYLNGLLMHETRGDKSFDYCYDANGQLYAVSYKASATAEPKTYYFSHNWRGDAVLILIMQMKGNLIFHCYGKLVRRECMRKKFFSIACLIFTLIIPIFTVINSIFYYLDHNYCSYFNIVNFNVSGIWLMLLKEARFFWQIVSIIVLVSVCICKIKPIVGDNLFTRTKSMSKKFNVV